MPSPGATLSPRFFPGATVPTPRPHRSRGLIVRELPPTRTSWIATTPAGNRHRWAEDELDPRNVPSDPNYSDTMPGGDDQATLVLPRKPGHDYSDLKRLSELTVYGVGGEPINSYRLEDTPDVSGDQMAVTPAARGYQAELDDDGSAREVYVASDLGSWMASSAARRVLLELFGLVVQEFSAETDEMLGLPRLKERIAFALAAGTGATVEAWWAAGLPLGRLYYEYDGTIPFPDDLDWDARVSTSDDLGGVSNFTDRTGRLVDASGAGYVDLDGALAVALRLIYTAIGGPDGTDFGNTYKNVRVYGNHGLPLYGPDPGGPLESDVVAHAIGTWAPGINFTIGPAGTIQPSAFPIPHLTYLDETTAGSIAKDATRFSLRDWAVWYPRTFYYHPRGARSRHWVARAGPSKLAQTGKTLARVRNGVVVRFTGTDGRTYRIGPPARYWPGGVSRADGEDERLVDRDPLNPGNAAGERLWEGLALADVATPAGAAEIGALYLDGLRDLDGSGEAVHTGYVEDSLGNLWPANRMHSGDYVRYRDASDPSERRIVKAQKQDASRSCGVSLDAPPDGLTALLERLKASLMPLGL